jgi:drug/metabolite transporter (DMT)-like permease
MLVSALAFALMTTFVKLAANRGVPLLEIVAARCLVSLVISYVDVRRKGLSVWGHHRPLLLARGFVGAFALICVYYAVTALPLAEATLLQYTHPVFTALLALLLLKEGIHLSTTVCIVLSIAGLVIMVEPGFFGAESTNLPMFPVAVALLGPLSSSVAYVIVRRLSQTEDASVIIFYFPLVAFPLSVMFLGNDFVVPDTESLLILLAVGVFTQAGQTGLTHAMRHERAGKAAAYSYVQVVFAVILGWAVFSEMPSPWTWIGGILIVAGALVNISRR